MKLNTKRTVLIGFAFFSICAFWQMYNNVIPLILTNTFHMNETVSGALMAVDNVLALFLLPYFGSVSDRCTNKMGKRMPFLVFGTLAAVAIMMFLPILDNAYAAQQSAWIVAAFVAVLFALLIVMGIYRSPAVALMPDLTPKPLRSQANAIINLMGAIGAILYLTAASFMYSPAKTQGLSHINYLPLFAFVALVMVISILIVKTTINEPEIQKEVQAFEDCHPEDRLTTEDESGKEVLPAPVKKSLTFLLVSIFLWFVAYNAVMTWFTTYASVQWNMALGSASKCLMVGNLGAIAAFIPIGKLSEKIGRKKTIQMGICLLTICFILMCIWTYTYGKDGGFNPILLVIMALIGVGWASINVNSLPMVVEMCKGSDIGKFTGYYYTFSMAAQIISPVMSGWLMRTINYDTLFIYGALFAAASFITMTMVKHGDAKRMA